MEITIKESDGQILHPSLDIKNGVLVVGFRYREEPDKESELFLIVKDGGIGYQAERSFENKGQRYFFEKDKRKLMRIEERWSIAGLNQFLNDYINAKSKSFTDSKAIFEQIKQLSKKYVELETDKDYSILAAWSIGTYFFPIFSAYPFLNIKAPKRSGKSQCLNLLSQLCFNAIKARPTLAALGDTVDALRGTYLIDQADSLERRGGEELLDILTDSYKKSGGKRRVVNFDKKKSREVLEFETYSPKVFASIRELPEDLRDRCFIVPLVRSQKNFPSPDDENENWKEIRGNLYKLLLTSYDLVANYYAVRKIEYKNQSDIVGRELELWLPLEVIFTAFGIDDEVEPAKKRFLSQYGFAEYEPSDIEEEVAKAILNQFQDKSEAILTPKEISELIDVDFFSAGETPKQRAAKVGWAIKKFNLSSEKKSRTKEGVRYLFEKDKVESIYKSYFKTDAEHTSLAQSNPAIQNPEQIVDIKAV
ncbi:MAG: hypothetical protein NTW46_03865 [Candidatus Nealsonbacteria bacterium]|nr:hypothetical protein [Candidatus Nealsonbacteria bacterium]